MRIQHNILAMNAYRNYNTNTSALSKNLEKLSSGYKINRAGDDAAGLAISEKMRAQITGLNAASKNVKDGISLVKTAEGAMQEIQDMLNRMDYLATQSANGTYQDEVDRENLNKEMSALKTEINRIADSANFNGIKLLDGSLDTNIKAMDQVTQDIVVKPSESEALKIGVKLAEVGDVIGENTVLHNDSNGGKGTSFSVDLHNFNFDASVAGNTMTLKIGDTELTLTATEDAGQLSGEDLVKAFLGENGAVKVSVSGEDNKNLVSANGLKINGQSFTVEKGADHDYRLTFTQDKGPTSEAEEVNGSMDVSISGKVEANLAKYSFDATSLGANPTDKSVLTINGESYTIDGTKFTTWEDVFKDIKKTGAMGGFDVSYKDGKVTMTATETGEKVEPVITYKAAAAGTATASPASTATPPGKTVTGADAKQAGSAANAAVAVTGITVAAATDTLTIDGQTVDLSSWSGTNAITNQQVGNFLVSVSTAGAVSVQGTKDAGAAANGTWDVVHSAGGTDTTAQVTLQAGADAVKDVQAFDLGEWTSSKLGDLTIGTGANAVTLNYDKLVAAGDKGIAVGNDYIATLEDNTLILTAKKAGAVASDGPGAQAVANATDLKYNVWDSANDKKSEDLGITEEAKGATGGEMQGITIGAHGDFNVSTTNITNVKSGGVDRLASTFFDLTEDMVREGSVITIAGTDYTFTEGGTGDTEIDISSGDLTKIAQLLTEKANADADTSKVYTVGHDGNRITLTETVEHAANYVKDPATGKVTFNGDYDLRTEAGIEKSLGFKGNSYKKTEVVSEATEGGKALNLQIGDTSDEFNQMKVSIGDMHVSAMKLTDEETGESTSIEDIDILTSDNAQKAVDVIKNAINYVSGVRGDLGAYQNRLEHTANNLSVMAENIQDAESTIRDTDIAEEMMSYTKNNILVQSAQAMLAQANAVPQGVLQLLG